MPQQWRIFRIIIIWPEKKSWKFSQCTNKACHIFIVMYWMRAIDGFHCSRNEKRILFVNACIISFIHLPNSNDWWTSIKLLLHFISFRLAAPSFNSINYENSYTFDSLHASFIPMLMKNESWHRMHWQFRQLMMSWFVNRTWTCVESRHLGQWTLQSPLSSSSGYLIVVSLLGIFNLDMQIWKHMEEYRMQNDEMVNWIYYSIGISSQEIYFKAEALDNWFRSKIYVCDRVCNHCTRNILLYTFSSLLGIFQNSFEDVLIRQYV